MESSLRGRHVIVASPYGIIPFLIMGVWLYVMVAGVAYASQATERAIRAEAIAARSQLEALRAQLNPHFLFNALHTVVQLIPEDPKRAAHAAEQLAALLRSTLEQDRDLVSLAEEWEFAQRYLEIETLRFGERLLVRSELTDDSRNALLPSFALQTLIENAVRHGAAPRIEPTEISIAARVDNDQLIISVADTGNGLNGARSNGTGLQRLRDRLSVLYSGRATLDVASPSAGGYTASLSIPQDED
jgi:LytS/YehU family sensor histidine kinase